MSKWTWVGIVALLMQGAAAADPSVAERFNRTCAACHVNGAAGAPRAGDTAAWAPRLAKGMDTLLASTRNGLRAMPPKGMCFDCTDDEFRALINYMATPR